MTSLSIVIDQHNEEATFLADLRDLAVHAPHYATEYEGVLQYLTATISNQPDGSGGAAADSSSPLSSEEHRDLGPRIHPELVENVLDMGIYSA